MKIVDVCAFYSPRGGGVRTYVEQKLRIGPQLGHEIVIVAPGDEDAVVERGPGARIVFIRSPRFPLDRKYWYFNEAERLHAVLDAEAPDFVEATSPWRSASLVAEWPGAAPRSLVMHADPLSAYAYRWFGPIFSRETIDRQFSMYWEHLRNNSRRFNHVVCANGDLSRRLREGGVANTVTIPMGVEPGCFSPSLRDPALRARLLDACELAESATLLLAIGRLAPEKRWPMVVDAVNAASREMPIGLVMLGEGREQRTILRHIAGNPHIRLLAPERDRRVFARILASADALLHGCEAETFCMVAAEARASGIPVIVPDAGGAVDHAQGGAGRTYAACDPAAAANAVLDVAVTRPRPQAGARTMNEHFEDLFAAYAATTATSRQAA
ncbi:glycosyltransferase [Novosphingobium mangrovi (ex Huang et al. 2023)]|uniref:Glycosyltransferase n=1 Tax=Novosphingobium mangrovi (ex Huang et al. 2023) TaxID=2976432 RepID=A0ABT2I426_9SPHN|nr:glycosyltransferase [Novosphingobium mangrovi (ex Huang et al. 2023)]MCT2399555.1 glycosyltransferase [Novosphingobium mangrovi (ex Huang et al. 2023)]